MVCGARFINAGELLPFPAMAPPCLALFQPAGFLSFPQLVISTIHFKSDGYKSRIPFRPYFC
jgi:hypothetical protein